MNDSGVGQILPIRSRQRDMSEPKDPKTAEQAAEAAPLAPEAAAPEVVLPSGIALTLVIVALVAALGTFLFLMGALGVEPDGTSAAILLGFDLLLVIGLVALIGRHLWRLGKASLAGRAGARMHRRVVGLFSLVAAVPTALVAGAGLVAVERGLTPWFSGDLNTLVQNAAVISQNFQQQICQNVIRETRLMAADLDRAQSSGFFSGNAQSFQSFFNVRASALGFPYAVIFKENGTMQERAQVGGRPIEPPTVAPEDFTYARTEEPPCLFSREAIGGVVHLKSFGDDSFLMVARPIDRRMLEFPVIARAGVLQYQVLEARRAATQSGIAMVFALLTLIGLLASVLLGLGFADRLVDPIRRLMQATDQVSAGNLYVQVPLAKIGSDLAPLGATFNNMTGVLRDQHESITAANALIESRRRFMEAVLSGVPAGVIGVDANGNISLINPTGRDILGLTEAETMGRPLGEVLPELAQTVDDARATPQRLVQTEVTRLRAGKERILSARVTGDSSGGQVITLDDITDLVTAQRTSAWADVARRIAHEIKNPLTPIQLSAERIRRKFGKVITEDRPIFDQCTDTIIRQVEDIKRMVDEFSSFARMPKPQPVVQDIAGTLREVVFMMRVGNPDVTFEERYPENPAPALYDPRLVAQGVQNLLKNACEAIAESPRAGQGAIRISFPEAGASEVVIDIEDNGKGFPVEGRARLLEPYMTTRAGGTGLGLPIVAKIFEDHGGRIELLDRLDNTPGARVRIHLPRAENVSNQRPEEAGRSAPPQDNQPDKAS